MKTKVNEIQVEVKVPSRYENWRATIRDEEIEDFTPIGTEKPDVERLEGYIQFCLEVIEAIRETK